MFDQRRWGEGLGYRDARSVHTIFYIFILKLGSGGVEFSLGHPVFNLVISGYII